MGNTLGFSSVILGRAVAAANGVTEQHLDTWLRKSTLILIHTALVYKMLLLYFLLITLNGQN